MSDIPENNIPIFMERWAVEYQVISALIYFGFFKSFLGCSHPGGWNSVYTGIQPTIKLSTVLRSTGALDFSLQLNGGLDFSLQSKAKALYFGLHLK